MENKQGARTSLLNLIADAQPKCPRVPSRDLTPGPIPYYRQSPKEPTYTATHYNLMYRSVP
jgi:hypothetical protein